jgi:hypothetical protein
MKTVTKPNPVRTRKNVRKEPVARQPAVTPVNTNESINPTRYEPSQSEIELRAYYIWEAEGRPEGCALHHWICAISQFEVT